MAQYRSTQTENNTVRWMRLVFWFNFVAGLVVVAMWLGKVGLSGKFWFFFNADTLYLPSVYLDLVEHGSGIRGWHLNASPNFFPDMILYGGLMAVLKSPALTHFIFSLVQFGVVMILLIWLFRAWDQGNGITASGKPGTRMAELVLVGLVPVVLAVSAMTGEDPLIPYQLTAPAFHTGVFINSLLVMVFSAAFLKRGRVAPMILAGIFSLLAVVSDRLFLVGGLFPLLVILVASIGRDPRSTGNWLLLGSLTTGSLTGMLLFRGMSNGESVQVISTGWKMFNFANAGSSLENLARHLGGIILNEPLQRWIIILALLFLVTAPVYLVSYFRPFLGKQDKVPEPQYLLVLLLFAGTLAVLFTPVINGSYLGPALIRYNYPALLTGAAGSLYLAILILRKSNRYTLVLQAFAFGSALILLSVITITGFRHNIAEGIGKFTRYYPERTQLIDSLKETHGLKYGLAGYWAAKPSTLFSREGLRIYPIHEENLKPAYHVTNENWFHDGGKGQFADPVFNFMVADSSRITSQQLRDHFGNDLDTIASWYDEYIIKVPEFKIDRESRGIILVN